MGGKSKKITKEYSKRGCLSCKKSHVKCDEKLPKCSRCTRRNTECVYPRNFKNSTIDVSSTESLAIKKQLVFESSPISLSARSAAQLNDNSPNILFTPEETSHLNQLPSFEESPYQISVSEASEVSYNVSPSINFDHLIPGKSDYDIMNEFKFQTIGQPNPFKFDIPWDGGPCVNFIATIKKNDPLHVSQMIAYNNQELIDFIWTMSRITKFFFTFTLFPNEPLCYIHDMCLKLNSNFPIIQSIMAYHASLHVGRLYHQTGNIEERDLWKRIEVFTFRQCIEFLKNGLESATTFVEFVVLTFTVVVIFSGNASNPSWRAHLTGCYQLLIKCHKLVPHVNKSNVEEISALDLFNTLVEWYRYTSFMAAISSQKGFPGLMLPFSRSEPYKTVAIPNNEVSFLSGQCRELDDFSKMMWLELQELELTGIRFSGLNCVYFAKTEQSPEVLKIAEEKGVTLLHALFQIQNNYTYTRLDSNDFKMDLTLRMCNLISFQGMHLYLLFFLTGERDPQKIRVLLRDLLDSFHSMPYKSSCAVIRHWILYIAALVALIQDETLIYEQFFEILQLLQANGMEIQSIEILEEVRHILEKQTYQDLISSHFDVVIC